MLKQATGKALEWIGMVKGPTVSFTCFFWAAIVLVSDYLA